MSSTRFTFTYEFESDLNSDDLKVEMDTNSADLDELLDRFQRFLVSTGFEVDMVQAAFNESELIPNELFSNDHYETVRKLESDLETAKMLYENERAMKLALEKELIASQIKGLESHGSRWIDDSGERVDPWEDDDNLVIGGIKCKRLKKD